MTKLIIIRHGETSWNLEGRAMGHLDSPLSEKGEKQAHAIAGRLSNAPIDALYSSDLGRAVQTAACIAAACELKIHTDAGLRERDMGIFAGYTRQEREQRFPEEWCKYRVKDNIDYVIPNGESQRQRSARGNATLNRLADRHPGSAIVVVTHAGILLGFLESVLGLTAGKGRQLKRANAAYNCFSREAGVWSLDVWGDISHLQDIA